MSQDTNEDWLRAIDRTTLTPLVRSLLDSETVEVIDWHYRPLLGGAGGVGGPADLQGLYRFAGTGNDKGETLPWSLILKYSRSTGQLTRADGLSIRSYGEPAWGSGDPALLQDR